MKSLLSLLFSSLFCLITLSAQDSWSLERCIQYATQNSISIKQAEVTVQNSEATQKGNKFARLPNLNARTSGGYQFGRTIDPATNVFSNQSIGSNSISLEAGVTLFNGNLINNSIKQGKLDIAAARADAQDAVNNLSLNVAAAYLNVLFAEEQLDNARTRLQQSQAQLEQTDKLIQAGSLAENERFQILAQIATDEQAVVTQENNVTIGYLDLKNLMQLPPEEELKIEKPEVLLPVIDPTGFELGSVYSQALSTQPIIRAGDLRIRSAQLDVDIARAGMLPSLSLFGNLRTDYNSKALDFAAPNLDNAQLVFGPEQPVQIDGANALLSEQNLIGVDFPNRKYTDQLSDNFGQSVGVSLNIPIYNNHRNVVAMERARLNIINTELTNDLNKQQLKANIQRAIADAKAAQKALNAAEKSAEALTVSYDNSQKRFGLGAINTFELTTAKNQLDQAKIDLTIARFDYLYKVKIVEFYQGKKLSL